MIVMNMWIFFSFYPLPFPFHVLLVGLSHCLFSHRKSGLANHINLILLGTVICPAIGIYTKQVTVLPWNWYINTEEEGLTFFLLRSAELWKSESGAVGRMKASRATQRGREAKPRVLMGMEFQSSRPWFLQLIWPCGLPSYIL